VTDRRVVQAVINYIGTALLGCILFLGFVLILDQHPDAVVFTALSAVTTTLAGGLVGLLASTRSTPPNPTEPPAAPPIAPPLPVAPAGGVEL